MVAPLVDRRDWLRLSGDGRSLASPRRIRDRLTRFVAGHELEYVLFTQRLTREGDAQRAAEEEGGDRAESGGGEGREVGAPAGVDEEDRADEGDPERATQLLRRAERA
jgi:hypothetical protein